MGRSVDEIIASLPAARQRAINVRARRMAKEMMDAAQPAGDTRSGERLESDYPAFLADVKRRILHARDSAIRAVNRELVLLYWDIGRGIVEKQKMAGWGDAVVERLAADLRAEFRDMRGFSARNVWDMRRFFDAYGTGDFLRQAVAELKAKAGPPAIRRRENADSDARHGNDAFLRQLVAEIPWGHHLLICNRQSDPAVRLYYLRATARLGWSRNVLWNQIKAGAYGI